MLCRLGLHRWRVYQRTANDIVLSHVCSACKKIRFSKNVALS